MSGTAMATPTPPSVASAVMVDTWHPSGRVRTSHRSAQCGQMFSSHAGARAGSSGLWFGTQVHVCLGGRVDGGFVSCYAYTLYVPEEDRALIKESIKNVAGHVGMLTRASVLRESHGIGGGKDNMASEWC
jgi:hypothetical protein